MRVHRRWLSQQLDNLAEKGDWRVLDLLARYKQYLVVEGKPTSPSKLLERLGFDAGDMTTRISDLSGGQRRRLHTAQRRGNRPAGVHV